MAVMNSKATEYKMILGKQSDDTLDYFNLFDAYRNNFEAGKPKLMKHQNWRMEKWKYPRNQHQAIEGKTPTINYIH